MKKSFLNQGLTPEDFETGFSDEYADPYASLDLSEWSQDIDGAIDNMQASMENEEQPDPEEVNEMFEENADTVLSGTGGVDLGGEMKDRLERKKRNETEEVEEPEPPKKDAFDDDPDWAGFEWK